MTIDGIGPLDHISKLNKANNAQQHSNVKKTDSVNVSQEAKDRAEVYNAIEQAKNAPDIREDRVQEVKAKLEDPSYIDDKVIETVADKLIDDVFGLS